jgi:O-antigen/teichoic acid export membrane protein
VAVPVVLSGLGADLYAVWVLAGALVMIQSLFDLGVASALVRYVAVAASKGGARTPVLRIAMRAMVFYLALSAVVFLPMWFGARSMVGLVHFLKPSELGAAIVIVRWAAVAFVLTNITLVAASVLQGIDHVGASYRDQTVGWLLYIPLLVAGIRFGSHAQAVGLAWVGAYAVQGLLLARSLTVGIRSIAPGGGAIPSFGEMLSFGGRWQLSAWADFATFQLPRFVAGAALSSGDVVSLDVAIRAGQFLVAPLFAFYPTILPRAASLLTRGGLPELRSFLQRWYGIGVLAVVIGVCVFIPIEVPLLAIWTGRPMSAFDPFVAAAVLIGTAAHASTGLLTSALMAQGDIRPVVVYKGRQLFLAAILLAVSAPIGLLPVALALCLSLILPAVAFNLYAAKELGLHGPVASIRTRWSLSAFALVQIAIPMALVVAVGSAVASWQLFGLAAIAAVICLAFAGLLLARRLSVRHYLWRLASLRPPDHLPKK